MCSSRAKSANRPPVLSYSEVRKMVDDKSETQTEDQLHVYLAGWSLLSRESVMTGNKSYSGHSEISQGSPQPHPLASGSLVTLSEVRGPRDWFKQGL